MTPDPHRPIATILAEIRDVETYLRDTPPHAASGSRESLQDRLRRLQRELRDARAARGAGGNGTSLT